ncbi:MAG: peptidylprolyl isomerase [Thermoplasmatota archaeon]
MRAAVLAALLIATTLAGCSTNDTTTTTTSGGSQTGVTTTGSGQTTTTSGAGQDPCATLPQYTVADKSDTIVAISTSVGCMVAELNDAKAPISVANFKTYVGEGFYSGLHCYRIVSNFVNQCGGERDGKTGSHPPIKNEAIASGLHNTQYTLAMARTNEADSATTEFYINAVTNCFLDPKSTSTCPAQANSDAGYAVFGMLLAGKDVSDRMNTMASQPAPTLNSIRVL